MEQSIMTSTRAADGTVALDMEAAVQDNLYNKTTYQRSANIQT